MFILVNTSSRNKIYDRFSFSDFTKSGFWEVDDVLRPVYEDASGILAAFFCIVCRYAKRS